MLKRAPTTTDGKIVDRLQESSRINKPFKPPTLAVQREQPQRKRKRVSYKGAQGDDASDDDDDGKKSKKKKTGKDAFESPRDNNIREFPIFKAKPFGEVARRFSIPSMKNSEGEYIQKAPSNISLGIRPLANIIPRPLHDPMEDHAIVLYDPTIDDRETDEERRAREKEEEKERAAQEAREKTTGLYNPHKSLKELLGGGKDKKKKNDKVAVVIDPRLCKVLRPHQVEGVKVSIRKHMLLQYLYCSAVLVQMYDWHGGREPVWLYYGRRDGSWQNSPVYSITLDTRQAVTSCRQTDDREMHHSMSIQFGEELGKRAW